MRRSTLPFKKLIEGSRVFPLLQSRGPDSKTVRHSSAILYSRYSRSSVLRRSLFRVGIASGLDRVDSQGCVHTNIAGVAAPQGLAQLRVGQHTRGTELLDPKPRLNTTLRLS